MAPRRVLVAALAALALGGVACGDQEVQQRQAEAPDDGMQMTGRIGGANLSVSYGDPDFQLADCDPQDGVDFDWCLRGRSIDGATVVLVFENPNVFVVDEPTDVVFSRCAGDCDRVTTGAVMELRVDGTSRRANGGTVTVTQAGPRYVAEFSLRFDDGGTMSGVMNVRPLGAIIPIGPSDAPTSEPTDGQSEPAAESSEG